MYPKTDSFMCSKCNACNATGRKEQTIAKRERVSPLTAYIRNHPDNWNIFYLETDKRQKDKKNRE